MSDYHPRPPGVNATELQARPVAATAPTDGQVLTWDHATQTWQPEAGGGGGGTKTIRSDTVSATNYIGSAPSGTATSATTWALTKIVVAAAGTTTVTHATDSWDNHLTATYT